MSENDPEKSGAVVDPAPEIKLLKWRKCGTMEDTKRRAWRAVRAAERALYASETRADVMDGAKAVSAAVQTYRRLLKDERDAERKDAQTVNLQQLAFWETALVQKITDVFEAHDVPAEAQEKIAVAFGESASPSAMLANAGDGVPE